MLGMDNYFVSDGNGVFPLDVYRQGHLDRTPCFYLKPGHGQSCESAKYSFAKQVASDERN